MGTARTIAEIDKLIGRLRIAQDQGGALVQQHRLYGNVCNWDSPNLNLDALVTPLGLSGPYKVYGIDHPDNERPEWQKSDELFTTPNMTVLHIVRFAALVHSQRNGATSSGHGFFEIITIQRKHRAITLTMGS